MNAFKSLIFIFILMAFQACDKPLTEVVEDTYEDGTTRVVRFYSENDGQKKLVKEKMFYQGGVLQLEGTYKDKKRDGLWTYYYKDGKKWSEANYKEGVNDGSSITWFENGQKRYEGTYKEGNKTGKWKFWDQKGTLEKEIEY